MGFKHFSVMFYQGFTMQLRQIKRNMMLFFAPIFIFLFVYIFFSYNEVEENFFEPIHIGFIIEDDNALIEMLAEGFTQLQSINDYVIIVQGDQETIYQAFYSGDLDAVIEMPKDFINSVLYFEYNPMLVKIKYDEPAKAVLIKNLALGYEKYMSNSETGIMMLIDQLILLDYDYETLVTYNERIAYDLFFSVLSRADLYTVHDIIDVPKISSIHYYFLAILIMFMMLIAAYCAMNLIKEKNDFCLMRLKLTRVSFFSYVLSKALSNSLFLMLILMCWYVFFAIFFNTSLNHLAIVSLCLGIFIFFDVALAMVIASFIWLEEGIILFSNMYIFINAILGGSIIPLHMMPNNMKGLSNITPNYWMIKSLLYLETSTNIFESIIISTLLLTVAILMILLASFRFRNINMGR